LSKPSDKFMATVISMQYFITTLSAVFGPNISGWMVELGGNNYAIIWLLTFGLMFIATLLVIPIKFGEPHKEAQMFVGD